MSKVFFVQLLSWCAWCVQCGPTEFLDCDWDDDWRNFRLKLTENVQLGSPKNAELAREAEILLQSNWPALQPDDKAIYGMSLAMQSFFLSCNSGPGKNLDPPFCLYGAICALWVSARHGHPERNRLLTHAKFLLGDVFRSALDFMEGSSWPLTSIDILANDVKDVQGFRLPHELRKIYHTPQGMHVGAQIKQPVFMVWEIGVHASLSAEPLQMWARIFTTVQLQHRNLIREQYPQWLPNKCETLYGHQRLSCDDRDDDITQLFRERIPQSATSKDPVEDMASLVAEFQQRFVRKTEKVDLFLCTVAYLCLLVEPLNKPIIGYFGHPLLFMVPDVEETREDFWHQFVGMARSRSVAFAVSDPFLQMQYEYQVGTRLEAIRTHALYTTATYFPVRTKEVLVLDRPHESVLMCLIRRSMGDDLHDGEWPMAEGRLRAAISAEYPYRFITRSLTDKKFKTFSQFRAVVLWAYDMDLITFYEFYSMNMPLFMPSHLSKYMFQQDHGAYDYQWKRRRLDFEAELWPRDATESPFQETNLDAVRRILPFTDYFRFPHVIYFDSIPDLLTRLPETDFMAVSQSMASFNQDALMETSSAWQRLLKRVDVSVPQI